MSLHIDRDRGVVRVGETVTYTVYASNEGPKACNVANAGIYVQLPGVDGQPVPEAQAVTLSTGENFSQGASRRLIGTVRTAINVTPGVTDAVVRAFTHGTLHDTVINDHDAAVQKTLGTVVIAPAITIAKTGSTIGGPAPQTVTYTYTVKNTTTPAALPDLYSAMSNVAPTDNLCAPLAYTGGDANGDARLNITETWTYTCTSVFNNAGVFVNTAKVCADNIPPAPDNIPKNYCSPPATWTVTVTPPAPVPVGAVKPLSVAQDKCKLSTPSGLKVRKGEVTTIKLTVRNVDAGSVARITLPGGKVLSAKTNSKGVATFKVKPTKTGTATIKVAECSEVERLAVRPARQVVAQRVPRVTG